MNYIFIVNPESGKKKGLCAGQAIDEYLKNKNINYKIYYTEKKNDAIEIAKLHRTSKDIVYSVGGDGTLNEVINGLANSHASLSIIPIGSGNDFYKSYKNFDGNYIDLGLVNNRYFINIASLGLDAHIANDANKLKDINMPNDIVYIFSLIKNFLKFKNINIDINGKEKQLVILTICNASYYGGGFKIAPEAILNDSMFDVFEVKSLNKLKTLKLLSKLIKTKHIGDKNVNYYRTDEIFVDADIPLICNIDGEIITGTSFEFLMEPEAIKVLTHDDLRIAEYLKTKKLIK